MKSRNDKLAHDVAEVLLGIGAVGFVIDKPITFKSGIISPIYVDNRRLPYYPDSWKVVLQGFRSLLKNKNIEYDVLAGVEAAGIPHSAALGYIVSKPSIFVRKQVKDHGTKKMVEGGEVQDKRVVLIEDLVTTGGSSLRGVGSLREEGAIVKDCMVLVSYGFVEAEESFREQKVSLQQLR